MRHKPRYDVLLSSIANVFLASMKHMCFFKRWKARTHIDVDNHRMFGIRRWLRRSRHIYWRDLFVVLTFLDDLKTGVVRGQNNLSLNERQVFGSLFFLGFESMLSFYLGSLLLLKLSFLTRILFRCTLILFVCAEGDFSWDCESDLSAQVRRALQI